MKQERKEELLHSFPPVPDSTMKIMNKKGAHNYAVMLTRGKELFVRCFHHYSRGGKNALAERQRYVFAKDGAVRYGTDNGGGWTIRSDFREPVFSKGCGYNFDNSYTVLGYKAIFKSDMRYSQADKYNGDLLMCYLKLYVKHPNLEYLMKQGYSHLLYEQDYGYWYRSRMKLETSGYINWKSNDLLKMLGLNRTEFKLLQGQESLYEAYIEWKYTYPSWKPEDIISLAVLAGHCHRAFEDCCAVTGINDLKLVRYLIKQIVEDIGDYEDYLQQCQRLKYDLTDTAVTMPKDFYAKHEELNEIERTIKRERDAQKNRLLDEQKVELDTTRKRLEFRSGELMLVLPKSVCDIVDEGAALSHCVGGYAERHAKGVLTIMFLRRADEPNKPYYTMEVSNGLNIVQCRGYANNVEHRGGKPKPNEVIEFEKEYQQYLDTLKKSDMLENKEKARISA